MFTQIILRQMLCTDFQLRITLNSRLPSDETFLGKNPRLVLADFSQVNH